MRYTIFDYFAKRIAHIAFLHKIVNHAYGKCEIKFTFAVYGISPISAVCQGF